MSVLERLNAAVDIAHAQGREIEEIDLTDKDFADLLSFAARFDENGLAQMELDSMHQKYRGYRLEFGHSLSESNIVRDDGSVPLPTDEEARRDERVVGG